MTGGAAEAGMKPLHFVVPGDPETRTGGYIYNNRIAAELGAFGWRTGVTGLDGRFPEADDPAVRSALDCLSSLDDGAVVVMDGLALSALPDVICAHAARLDIIGLIHLALCDETGLEEGARRLYREREVAALAAVRRIVVTSDFMVRRLGELGVAADRIRVARPGTDPAPLATGSGGPGMHMVCVATVTPRKRHDVLLRALGDLREHDWMLTCVGDTGRDRAWAEEIFAYVGQLGIGDRVSFAGVKSGDALSACYDAADLFVLASEYESFGMVFTEALAHGLPIVATRGGAIPETIPKDACELVRPGDVAAMKTALSGVLNNDGRVETLRAGAVAARDGLEDWARSAAVFDGHLRELTDQ